MVSRDSFLGAIVAGWIGWLAAAAGAQQVSADSDLIARFTDCEVFNVTGDEYSATVFRSTMWFSRRRAGKTEREFVDEKREGRESSPLASSF